MKYLFGPVNSRRLGRSLGIDLLVEKICSLNCVYCEVGPTQRCTMRRDEYVPTAAIVQEIDAFCADTHRLDEVDVMTVTASGEPTLHSGLGQILSHLRSRVGKPVVVLTNGTTLYLPEVRQELAQADIVVPSLDAALEDAFRRVDRPAQSLDFSAVLDGLRRFSHQFTGQIWLEVLLVAGLNDGPAEIEALCQTIATMRVDRVQLNTVARPPLESFARPVSHDRLRQIAGSLHQALKIPVEQLTQAPSPPSSGEANSFDQAGSQTADQLEAILQMVRRRPCTAVDIDRTFHLGGQEIVAQLLAPLVQAGTLRTQIHGEQTYYH